MASPDKTRITAVRPPQIAKQPACLVQIYPPGVDIGRRYPLDAAQTIGRGDDCDIPVDLDSVSRSHARVKRKAAGFSVADLGSTNGTYVNEKLVEKEQLLADGDLVQVGNAIFKFLSGGNVEAGYHEAIYQMTIVDALTEAHNKRYLTEFLDREIARATRYGRPLSLVMLDLDHFKQINDAHGHLTGDYVLRELARRLRSRIRKEELLARYGGEEFVIVLPETAHRGAMKFAEQIRHIAESVPFEFEGDVIPVTISVGVATVEGSAIDSSAFLKQADENMYRAKRAGRNRVVG